MQLLFFQVILSAQLTLFNMGIFGAAYGWGGQKGTPPLTKICHTYPTMMKLGSYSLPKEDPKNISITRHTPWVLLTSAFSHWKSANFVISRNTDIDCISMHNFALFSQSLKIFLINLVIILIMSAKKATPELLKVMVYWNKVMTS